MGGLSSPWLCPLYYEAVIPACLVHTDASHTQCMQTVKLRAHVLGGHHRAAEEQECGWRPARSTAPDAPGHPRQGPCSALHCGHLSVGPCAGPGRDIEWKVLTVIEPVLSASHMSPYAILGHSRTVISLMSVLQWRKLRMAKEGARGQQANSGLCHLVTG